MKPSNPASETPGRFAYEGLPRVLHEKARLGIMTSLATHPGGLLFTDLKELCSLTDGNLNRHLKVLQDERLIEIRKDESPKRPQTVCGMTAEGRKRFLQYVAELERVVSDAAAAVQTVASSSNRNKSKGNIHGKLSPA